MKEKYHRNINNNDSVNQMKQKKYRKNNYNAKNLHENQLQKCNGKTLLFILSTT